MKQLLTLVFALFLLHASYSQSLSPQVIASAGGYFTSASGSLSWTLGETITQTFTNGSNMLTQGFQQPSVNMTLLNLKAYLEGFYSGSGQMNSSGSGGCLFITGNSANALDVDTIEVSAINPVSLTEADVKKVIIKTDGTASVTFGSGVVAGNTYYIRVKHRNSLETWSASPVLMSASVSYDFTDAASKAYGSNMVQTFDPGVWAFYSGDISDATLAIVGVQDGIIEAQDYLDMENAVSLIYIGYVPADITGDATVEATDYLIMENNVAGLKFSVHP